MNLYIVTGFTRGLGYAFVKQLLNKENVVLGISRRYSKSLELEAKAAGGELIQWVFDLKEIEPVAKKLGAWLSEYEHGCTSLTLINNVGNIPPLANLGDMNFSDLKNCLHLNLEAPLLLTSAFLRASRDWTCARKVLSISSNLARKGAESLSSYCAAKVAIDQFTCCAVMEERKKVNGAKLCSIAPRVLDTSEQTHLLNADPVLFPEQMQFAEICRNKKLTSPEDGAKELLDYLHSPQFGLVPVADVRTLNISDAVE